MMSRRSRRAIKPKRLLLPVNVISGIRSLVEHNNNEDIIIAMLSLDSNSKVDKIVDKIIDCMSVNNLTAEMLLARFFDESVLGQYCHACLNKSAKGSSAILASRIAREWSKPNFTPTNTNITSSSKKQLNNNNNKGTESSDEEDYMSMIHASRNATLQKAIETDNSTIKGDSISIRNETDVDESSDSDNDNTNNVLLFQNIKRKMKKLKLKLKSLKKQNSTRSNAENDNAVCKSIIKILNWVSNIVKKEIMTKRLVVETNLAKIIGRVCKLENKYNNKKYSSNLASFANDIKAKIVKQLDEERAE